MNIYKRFGIGFAIFIASGAVVYFSAVSLIPNVIDLNKYKEQIAAELEEQSGFKFSCEDMSIKKNFLPVLDIKMHHSVILYPDDEIFLKVNDAELKVKLFPLLFKKISVKEAQFTRPIANIILYKDLTTSLDKYLNNQEKNTVNRQVKDFLIKNILCERYKLNIFDETTNKNFYVEGNELKIIDYKFGDRINLLIKGSLFENKKEYISYDLALKSYIDDKSQKLTVSPFKQLLDFQVKGSVSGQIELLKNNNYKGNINLSDFSLNIDNNVLSNNSANLTFKGEEIIINSELHTSNKDEAKVSGKFNCGKKKYIDLAVKAKNVNIFKLHKILKAFSHSLNIKDDVFDVKLTGLLNADFKVNSDFKKLKSNGSAEIINAELTHKDLPYKINRINSIINFNNNKIAIEKAQAYVNSALINIEGVVNEDVSLDIKAFSDNLDLKTVSKLIPEDINMPLSMLRGKLSFVSQINGKLDKKLKTDTQIVVTDFNAVEKSLKLPLNASKIELNLKNNNNKYSGEVLCSDFKTIYNSKPIMAEQIAFIFDNKTIKLPKHTVKIIDSPLTLSGVINDYSQNPTGYIDFSGNIKAKNAGELISEFVKQPYKAVGDINSSGKVELTSEGFKLNAKLKADKDNYISYMVIKELLNKPSVLNIDAEINGEDINIKDISLKEDNTSKIESSIKISGRALNQKELLFKNMRIQIPESLTASMNFFGGEEVSLNGDIILNDSVNKPDIKGNVKVQRYIIKKLYTSVKNADIYLGNNNIRVIAPEIDINNSKFNVILDIDSKISNVINITNAQVNSLNLDLNTLFPLFNSQNNIFANTILNIKKGSATISNFKVLDLKARDISADFILKNNLLKIDSVTASAYSGRVSGAIGYDFNNSNLDINLIGKGLDIKNSLYDLCKIEDNLSGKTDFTSSLTMKPGDYEAALKSLSGKITFSSKDGKMGTLGKFEYYMNAKNLLYHGLLNATLNRIVDAVKPDNTAKYKTAEGSILLQNGYIIANEIRTCGQNMSLTLKGRYNMLSNLANIDIYGRISDGIKSKLGSFADVSISELVNGQPSKKNVTVMTVPSSVIDNIYLWGRSNNAGTNTFKVNIYGNMNSPSSINSFSWVVSDENDNKELPEFSDIPESL